MRDLGESRVSIVRDPDSLPQKFYICGVISTTLFAVFIVVSVWRSIVGFQKFKGSFEHKKMIIHITLLCFGFCEFIYGISFITEKE
jgi:hypothetical protein